MPNEKRIYEIAQEVHDQNAASDQFAVPQSPLHNHDGTNSSNVNYNNLTNRSEFLHVVIPGTSATTNTNYGVFFTIPYPRGCIFLGATEVHSTAGVSTPTLQIERLISTTATGSGINLLAMPFNLSATANTPQTAIRAFLPNSSFNFNQGDRIGLSVSGTLTSVANVVVVIQLSY